MKADLAVRCVQCGDPHPVRLRGRRRSCRSCGAVFRAAPVVPRSVAGDPLEPYLPARMVRWIRDNDDDAAPDRAAMTRWYREFDALVARARTDESAAGLLAEVSEVPAGELPAKPVAFPQVCAALHATCYDLRLARERLAPDDPWAAERLGHVRAWFAGPGRADTWAAGPPVAAPDPEAVRKLLPLPERFESGPLRTFFAALFQVERGPSPTGVLERFGAEAVEDALRAWLRDGSYPLRERVIADLDAG
ncbi:hypothetical protein [Nonomuraea wenchangensis]|uniref:Uncharacterized protein n=1 Tax=Nonomuraea wenchangensis TaxID=568860 RepID=A0A1I0ANW9_9ACTN|nr:hypothetical protein [Nonomuraea wenchangensis]SES96017.1 hypothetical protein SAMN05421811_101860 [Nonomuraea wenchangensis]